MHAESLREHLRENSGPIGFSVIVTPWFLPTLSLDFKLELLAKDPKSKFLIYSELGRDVVWGMEAV